MSWVPAFYPVSQGCDPTYEGKLLHEYVESALNLVNMGESKLAELQPESGELKIGVGDTISKYFLLPYMVKFHQMYPKSTRVINARPRTCARWLNREIDLAMQPARKDPALKIKKCIPYMMSLSAGTGSRKHAVCP